MLKKIDKNFSKFVKNKPHDKIWWTSVINEKGNMYFSFDKENIYRLFGDYPKNLTKEQLEIFNKENPYWKAFFNGEDMGEENG